MKKFTLALGFAALMPMVSSAQRYLGIATGNWSGTNSLYLNPANVADNRHKFSIDLVSFNMGFDNNVVKAGFKDVADAITEAGDDGGGLGSIFDFKGAKNGKASLLGPTFEVRGPGFMASIGRKHGIALTTRMRFMMQAHNMDASLFQKLIDEDVDGIDINQPFVVDPFNATLNAWSEVGITYGAVIYENDQHQIKGGVTGRLIRGAGYFSIVNDNLNIRYRDAQGTIEVENSGFEYGSNMVNTEDLSKNLLKSTGKGFGLDLGLVYEWRPNAARYRYDMDGKTGLIDKSKNVYKLKFSAAVTDIGSMTYKENNSSAYFRNVPANSTAIINAQELGENISNFDEFRGYLATRGIATDSNINNETKVGLPTALVVSVDYNIWQRLYVSATYIGNMASRSKMGNSYYNQFTVTPRIDTRVVSLAMPITYNTLASSMYLGLGVRFGGFFVGSDNLLGLSNNKGLNGYMGFNVPIAKKKPRDSDGDGVSNKRDKCRREKGDWANRGCPPPDKDGDGILDDADKCPDIAGTESAQGCPDADGDGITDAEDTCPQDAGSIALQGCPDADGDGIADNVDKCPNVAGLAQLQGCPDTDKDGIADNEDQCPDQPGSIAMNGCPDTDNDGIADNVDKCPSKPGTADNGGCPAVSEATKKRLSIIGGAIQFETGKATIKKVSFVQLDEVVRIMNQNPDYSMSVEGHTDNVGKPENNMTLSQNRADAVKNYLVGKGIDAGRISATGYGDTRPIDDNKTPKGRTANRRVAMTMNLDK